MAPAALAVAHAMPGRLRLRLPFPAQTSELADAVRAAGGVTNCTWNERTRGLLVHYRPEETTAGAIIETVANHAGVTAPDDDHDAAPGGATASEVITSTVTHLNTRVAHATGRRLDLGMLVPLTLGAWALRQLFRAQVEPLAWSSALWYAHGLFRDYAMRDRS